MSYRPFTAAHRLWSCQMGSGVVECVLSCSVACGILVPRRGMEPASPACKADFFFLATIFFFF